VAVFDPDGELPPEVVGAAEDPRCIEELRLIFQRNSRHEDGAKRYLDQAEAESLARRVLTELLDPEGFRMAEVGGMRFYLQVGTEAYPGPNEILAQAWDANQWRPVGRVRLPGGTREEPS
jgi:hypothetical protein